MIQAMAASRCAVYAGDAQIPMILCPPACVATCLRKQQFLPLAANTTSADHCVLLWRVLVQPCGALGLACVCEPERQHQWHSIVLCISLCELALFAAVICAACILGVEAFPLQVCWCLRIGRVACALAPRSCVAARMGAH